MTAPTPRPPRPEPDTAPVRSMRQRLLRLQALSLLAVGLLAGLLSFGLTWQYLNDEHDRLLEQVAQTVVRHGLTAENDEDPDPVDRGQFVSQIWSEDGTLQYPAEPDTGPPRQAEGWHTVTWQQQRWQVYTLVQDGLVIQISQPLRSRNEAFWDEAPALVAGLLALTGMLLALLHTAVHRSLRPLEQLRQQIDRIHPGEPAPVRGGPGWPADLAPLVRTLDALLLGIHDAQSAHRDTVARAAHELRTPLSALKIHLQLLDRTPDGAHAPHHRAQALAAAERLNRLVDQLLHLAELETPDTQPAPQDTDVPAALAPLQALWQPLAQAQNTPLTVTVPPGAVLRGHPRAWLALLDNLVHNAIRCGASPQGIQLVLAADGADAVWTVTDHGPGLSPQQMARVNQGHKPLLDRHEGGTGLGLHIAQRAAQRHGGTLQLANTLGGGLTATVRLPGAWVATPASEPPSPDTRR